MSRFLFTAMPALTLEQAVAEAVAAGATCFDGEDFDGARADQISVELVSWIRAHQPDLAPDGVTFADEPGAP